jgi:DNA-binding GntR family transcriptional regulator
MAKRAFLTPASAADPDRASDEGASSRTLIERAYAQLRDDIIEGKLSPNERLRVEHLKDHYNVSAGTLREAITRLASDALVVAEGQRGFRVAPVTVEDLEDLTALRLHIEIAALRSSIRHGDAAWREHVRQAFEALSSVEQPVDPTRRKQYEQLNLRFHEALIAACGSPWTLKVLRLLGRQSERYRRYTIGLTGCHRDVHAEHQQIYEFAMSGQEARAALALEAHIRMTPDLLIAAWRSGQLSEFC